MYQSDRDGHRTKDRTQSTENNYNNNDDAAVAAAAATATEVAIVVDKQDMDMLWQEETRHEAVHQLERAN